MYDLLMIGWELEYSRNRVMVDREKLKVKEIKIDKNIFIIRHIKILLQTLIAIIFTKTQTIYIPAFNQVNSPFIILLAKIFKKKLIIDILVSEYDTVVHDRKLVKVGSLKSKKAYFFDVICLKYADELICDTQLHKDFFVKKFKCAPEKITVIPVGAEEHFDYIKNIQRKETFNIIFYGGFSPLHGIDVILKAASLLQSDSSIKITLVGEGQTKREMLHLAKTLGLSNVEFLSRVEYSELPVFLNKFDVGLGIFGDTDKAKRVVPNKAYQVAACKLPMVTSNTPGIREVFTNNQDSILISKGDFEVEELANKIKYLKENEDFRSNLAQNGYELIKQNYSVEIIRKKFLDIATS